MLIDFDELMKQLEMYIEDQAKTCRRCTAGSGEMLSLLRSLRSRPDNPGASCAQVDENRPQEIVGGPNADPQRPQRRPGVTRATESADQARTALFMA